MGRADLHAHTTASDGTLGPQALVRAAKQAGLNAVGVTDHDTTLAVPKAVDAGMRHGVVVVPGVELSCEEEAFEVHILGYFIDVESAPLQAKLKALRRGRIERIRKILAKLDQLGVHIEFEEVVARARHGAIGRPHVASILFEQGHGTTQRDAFRKYLSKDSPAYVPRDRLTPAQAIALVVSAGGVPVFAHPGLVGLDRLIDELIPVGLRGIEVWYPEHTTEMVSKYERIARERGLIMTGGSDSHGPGGSRNVPVGQVTVGMEVVEALREASEQVRAAQREVG